MAVVLRDYLYKTEVEELLADLEDDTKGTLTELSGRLRENPHFKPETALRKLRVWQRRELCRQRGKDSKAAPEVLIAQLLEVLREEPQVMPASRKPAWWALLHPEVRRVAESRYEARHFADAVEAAMKEVNVRVKRQYRLQSGAEIDGTSLMTEVFSGDSPLMPLADLGDQSGRDEQKGYMFLFAGSMLAIRNPKTHANVEIDGPRAMHHLFLASLLMHKLDDAGIP